MLVVLITFLIVGISVHILRSHSGSGEIVLEFGMFTGSNWDVESATSFVIIDKAIEQFEEEHPGVKIHYYSGVLKEDYSEWFSRKLLEGEAPDVFMVLADDFKIDQRQQPGRAVAAPEAYNAANLRIGKGPDFSVIDDGSVLDDQLHRKALEVINDGEICQITRRDGTAVV